MKAISMWQPWASLWLTDAKIHETRGRQIHYRGWLLVHAAKRIEHEVDTALRLICEDHFGGHWGMDLPRGAIIGAVNIVDCHTTEFLIRKWKEPDGGPIGIAHWDDFQCGNYGPKRFAYERAPEIKVFATPIPYRGMQAVPFDIPDEVVREALDMARPS